MRVLKQIREPEDKNVIWARPNASGQYDEQIWGPNGWEPIGSGGSGPGGPETDPVYRSERVLLATKAELSTYETKTGVDTKITAALQGTATDTELADLETRIETELDGYVTKTELEEALDGLSIPGAMQWHDSVSSESALPTGLTTDDEGYTLQVEDTGASYLWNGTKWIKLSGVTDLSNYDTKTQVDAKVAEKQDATTVGQAGQVLLGGSTAGTFTTKTIDTTPSSGSDNLITSGAIYTVNTNLTTEINDVDTRVSTLEAKASDFVTTTNLNAILATIPIAHVPEIFTVADPVVATFTLDKTPEFISEALVLNGDTALYYLQASDYSVDGKNITITNPTLTPGWRVKVIYTYVYGS